MRVISGPIRWEMKISCRKCNAFLLIDEDDLRVGQRNLIGVYCGALGCGNFIALPLAFQQYAMNIRLWESARDNTQATP